MPQAAEEIDQQPENRVSVLCLLRRPLLACFRFHIAVDALGQRGMKKAVRVILVRQRRGTGSVGSAYRKRSAAVDRNDGARLAPDGIEDDIDLSPWISGCNLARCVLVCANGEHRRLAQEPSKLDVVASGVDAEFDQDRFE